MACLVIQLVTSCLTYLSSSGTKIEDPNLIELLSNVNYKFSILAVLISIIFLNPLRVGLSGYFIKNTNGSPKLSEIFSRFKTGYSTNVVTMFLRNLKIFLWTLLFIIPGIIKYYEYAMIPFILAEHSEINYDKAFSKSKEMMKGNKLKLFKLQLSFIGWFLLSLLTCGIGFVFLSPYIKSAEAEFYIALKEECY